MENQKQENIKAKSLTENPKPTDDVQLAIETVTPDTHQPVSEACTNDKIDENKVENSNKEADKIDQEIANETSTEEEKDNKENIDKPGDDERDKIETIAP